MQWIKEDKILKVETYIDQSKIAGLGLFAGEEIPKGKIVWIYNPLVDISYSAEEWAELMESVSLAARDRLSKYSYQLADKTVVELDGGQFINHSSTEFNLSSDSADATEVYATRDIAKGEELLSNYLNFCDAEELSFDPS